MKTLELDLKKKVLIVDLPIDSKNVYMSGNSIIYNTDKSCIAKPINDEYEFLCKGSELTEEIASELVELTIMHLTYGGNKHKYRSYVNYNLGFDNALDSFKSAIESKGFFWMENPISLERVRIYESVGDTFKSNGIKKIWKEVEEKTFKNPLIFVKK